MVQPHPPVQRRAHGLATAGFVVALCGALLSLVPFVGVVAWVVAPVGLVLSVVGYGRSALSGGRGLAVAGMVLGAFGLVMCVLWMVGFAAAGGMSTNSF
jgi:hypothetical protein